MTRPRLVRSLKAMKSEVGEFHPLLEIVFREMPSVTAVKNTHGNSEMGADFILSRHDEEFADPEHVGVIVKIGKITQQHSDVDRQIDECSVKRITIDGQAKEIYLSEIWVIVNGSISNGAKAKIHERYKSKNIKFVDIELLADWTTRYVPHFGLNLSLDEGDFLEKERMLALERDSKTSLLPAQIDKFYIEQQIVEYRDVTYDKPRNRRKRIKAARTVDLHTEIERSKILTIESPMGGGKSKLLNVLTQHYAKSTTYSDTKLLPIYLRFSELLELEFENEADLIAQLNSTNSLKVNPDRTYFLLLDGLDEVKLDDDQRIRLSKFLQTAHTSTRLKTIITSRNIRDNDLEIQLSKVSNRYEIKPLTINLIIKFIVKVCSKLDLKGQLIEDLKKTQLFHSLPKTPIAALILSRILSERTEDLPSNLTELYAQYTELALGRWDDKNGLEFLMQFEALESILGDLAEFLLTNSLSIISRSETEDIFRTYLQTRNFDIQAEELLENALERSDILVHDAKSNTVSFKHKSFAEFFYAKKLSLLQEIELDSSVFDPYWVNCYYFLAGLKKDCPDLIKSLLNLELPEQRQRILRIFSLGNILLAAYKTPYDVIISGLKASFQDAADIYLETQNEVVKSPFAKLPPMAFLALLRCLMEDCYSYTYFDKAIVEIITDLATDPDQSERTAYILFFLDMARKDLDGSKVFVDLVEAYSEKLPLPIQLAIGHETSDFHKAPAPIKRMEKRVRKSVGSSRSFKAAVIDLYDKSIDGSQRIIRKSSPTQK